MSMVYGYVRVSSKDQNVARQLAALEQFHLEKKCLFIDKMSGKDFNRPNYIRLMKKLKEGDIMIVKSIDRLGRNYEEIIEQWRLITKEKKADIKVLDMPLLDTTLSKDILGTFIADLVLQVLSFCAHEERSNIKQRQKEGIAAAKKRGVRFGRAPLNLPDNFKDMVQYFETKQISEKEVLENLHMSRTSFYKYKKEYQK
ncbi:MAG: recombinase family protein [Coprobacillus sp.]